MAYPAKALPESTPEREIARHCGGLFRFALFFSALVNILFLAPTLYMLQVYDRVIPSGSNLTLLFLTVALAGALATMSYLEKTRSRILSGVAMRFERAFASKLVEAALSPATEAAPPRLRPLLRNLDTVRQTLTGPAMNGLLDLPWTPIYLLVCFILHWSIGALALAGATILLLLAILNERLTRTPARRVGERISGFQDLQDAVTSAPDVVVALGMRTGLAAKLGQARSDADEPQRELQQAAGQIGGLIRFLRMLLQSLALGLAAWLAINKEISGGAIFASSMLMSRALAPVDQVVGQWRTLAAARTAYHEIRTWLSARITETPTALPRPVPSLTVERLAVLSPTRDRLLLRDISFALPAGSILAVIGPSGAGKTTLLQTLAHARGYDQGEIRLDGAKPSEWEPEALGRHLGYLPQDFALFPGTVKDNISRFERWAGRDAASVDAATIEAARAAGVLELILRLPGGFETVLGPRGRGLSAGQQQRIALARSIYGDPVLYLFDEPNAALDAEGESVLIQVMTRLRNAGGSVVFSAHRSRLLSAADFVLVLNEGRMTRFGARDEVLASLKGSDSTPITAPFPMRAAAT